jgi:glycogen synthase
VRKAGKEVEMQALRVLLVAPELAPFTGEGEQAQALRSLTRALCNLKRKVVITAVIPKIKGRDPENWGLARRLAPITVEVGGQTLAVGLHEGPLPGGGVRALIADAGDHPSPYAVLTHLAYQLASRESLPHAIHACDGSAEALLVARERGAAAGAPGTPLRVISISDPEAPLSPALREALGACDRAVVGSAALARELTARGVGLVGALGDATKLTGVPAGIDETRWRPDRDFHLPAVYSAETLAGKASCKRELQRELGLPPRAYLPLIAAVGPLPYLDADTAEALVALDAQLAFLPEEGAANGQSAIADLVRTLAARLPTRVVVANPSGDARERLLHCLVAGADLFLIARPPAPSGVGELFCLGYGTLPILPRLGSFADTVVDVHPRTNTGSGFLFDPTARDLVSAARRAVRALCSNSRTELARRAMALDLSWRTAAQRYADIYAQSLRAQAPRELAAS